MVEVQPALTCQPAPAGSGRAGLESATDPGRDGLVGIYALRILDRGVDPRAVVAEHRSIRYGLPGRLSRRYATPDESLTITSVGRGAGAVVQPASEPAEAAPPVAPVVRSARVRRLSLPSLHGLSALVFAQQPARNPRRLVTAGFAIAAVLGFGAMSAFAQEVPAQQQYVVQEGDTLESVAAEFGVAPEAILAASGLESTPWLTPAEVVVIPAPTQEPADAAVMAAELAGGSPFVTNAYYVGEGDTLTDVAGWFQVPVAELAAFNGLTDPDLLEAGQRLLIPAQDDPAAAESDLAVDAAEDDLATAPVSAEDDGLAAFETAPDLISAEQPALAPDQLAAPSDGAVMVPGVPAASQEHTLSGAYAAGFIATSAFGAGVPESAFVDAVPLSPNPHWGFRGNLDGTWGETTDYGVYAEPLVPVLDANGFDAEVFYGYGDPAPLTARLDAGLPVIVWLGFFGDTAYAVEDDGSYLLAPGMHTVVVSGYDEYGVYVSDPASGTLDVYAWEDFLAMWSVLDGMSLAVSPR